MEGFYPIQASFNPALTSTTIIQFAGLCVLELKRKNKQNEEEGTNTLSAITEITESLRKL
jgi:hypothetical protein